MRYINTMRDYFTTRTLPVRRPSAAIDRGLYGHGLALHFIDGVAQMLRLEAPFTSSIRVRRTTR